MIHATSDFQPRPNAPTADEWLNAVIHSGQVTRISQHLALVLYHLADPVTGATKQSVRDLELITGWSRDTIADRLAELEVFMRITLGRGRAKTEFELQYAVTETIAGWKNKRIASAWSDAKPEVRPAKAVDDYAVAADEADATAVAWNILHFPSPIPASIVAAQVDAVSDAIADMSVASDAATATTDAMSGAKLRNDLASDRADAGYVVVSDHADAKFEKRAMGGTIGGENNNYPSESLSLSPLPTRKSAPAPIGIQADGSFTGYVFELTSNEVDSLARNYPLLSFPGDLVAADLFFKSEFAKHADQDYPEMPARMARLAQYLASANRKAQNNGRLLELAAGRKPERRPPEAKKEDVCWFDSHARLQVANGFEAELLEMVGGDKAALRIELDCAAAFVGTGANSFELIKKVRSRVRSQTKEKRDRDERYARSVSNRAPTASADDKQQSLAEIARQAARAARRAKTDKEA